MRASPPVTFPARRPGRGASAVFLAALLAGALAGCGGGREYRPVESPRYALPAGTIAAKGARTDRTTDLPTRILHLPSRITLALVRPGSLQMGTPGERFGPERRHKRRITQPFYLAETEVTVGQFARFVDASGYVTEAQRGVPEDKQSLGALTYEESGRLAWHHEASWRNPSPYLAASQQTDDYPVVQVTWNDAQAFCTHFGFSLPTEAQWEYACRAGSSARYPWGRKESGGKGFINGADLAARLRFPSWEEPFPFSDTHQLRAPVADGRPNDWGFYDMIGNVEEWCQDWYKDSYPPDGTDEWAVEDTPDTRRVVRGGSWAGGPAQCRSAYRNKLEPFGRRDFIGFRVVLPVSE